MTYNGKTNWVNNEIVKATDMNRIEQGIKDNDINKAPINSPTFTGIPSSVTPAVNDNTTKIATTAFVNSEIANDRPYATTTTTLINGGTGIVGTSSKVAREDHTHTMPKSVLQSQVINDLITGGATNVLSAEQGKVLFQSVVDGKNAIATAINDLAGSTVATKEMTHTDLSVTMRNNLNTVDIDVVQEVMMKDPYWYTKRPQLGTIIVGSISIATPSSNTYTTKTQTFTVTLDSGVYYFIGIHKTSYGTVNHSITNIKKIGGTGLMIYGFGETSSSPAQPAVGVYVKGICTMEITCKSEVQNNQTYTYTLTKIGVN